MKSSHIVIAFFIVVSSSCTTSGPAMFGKRTPHEAYGDKLKNADLNQTALGILWFEAANKSLISPANIKLPYKETGYFPADLPRAVGLKFSAKRGEKISISILKKPVTAFAVFVDVYKPGNTDNSTPKLVTSADTSKATLDYEIREDGVYLVRLQPELLKSGEYTLTITNNASLGFPVSKEYKSNIGSFWGAGRDGGARKHEGIDIFAAKRTPIVAVADAVVDAVNETAIGGKVVWLRPVDKDYILYYAHLDEQLVQPGQRIKAGEVVGLMGNTGNAKTTTAHLHFGIYTNGGAVDPLPFVNREIKLPPKISASTGLVGNMIRAIKLTSVTSGEEEKLISILPNTPMTVIAAHENFYRVFLPDGNIGNIASSAVTDLLKPIRNSKLLLNQDLLEAPNETSPKKNIVNAGESVSVLASYGNYYYVSFKDEKGWLSKKAL